MSDSKQNRLPIAIVVIGVFIIGYVFINRTHETFVEPIINTVTDTTYVPIPYPVMGGIVRDTVKPDVVTIYQQDSSALKNLRIKLIEDSLRFSIIIQSLTDTIEQLRIHELYLTQFPKNPKLLGLQLYKDSLNLDLLNIDGVIHSEKYSLFLDNYYYRWSDGVMGYSKVKKKISLRKIKQYGFLSYDLVNLKPSVGYGIELPLPILKSSYLTLEANQVLLFNENLNLRLMYKVEF